MDYEKAVLIVGGYGLVGEQTARILRSRHPELPMLIAGRDLTKASTLAIKLGKAEGIAIDISESDPLASLNTMPAAVLSSVYDVNDGLLPSAVERGVAYVEIAGGMDNLELKLKKLSKKSLRAPVMLAANWIAGVPAILAHAASDLLATTESVLVDSLYSVKDKAGPDTAVFADHLTRPFHVFEDGQHVLHQPNSVGRTTVFRNGASFKVFTFDCQDHITIPMATNARRVHVSLGVDDPILAQISALLARTGLIKLFNLPLMQGMRRRLFFNPGKGASHEVVIQVAGTNNSGDQHIVDVTIFDPLGQSHLTACGAVLAVERVLGFGTLPKLSPDIYYPDTSPDIENTLGILCENGVVTESSESLTVAVASASKEAAKEIE